MAGIMAAAFMAGCSDTKSNDSGDSGDSGSSAKGQVYYLNFKPEQDKQWQDLAKAYEKETGVKVTVSTAAEGTYESTLTAEMDKDNAPTLFQVNGPVGLKNWKDFCLDLKDSEVYKNLTSENFALKEGDSVYGVAYVVETYGIIYNKTLLQKYFDSDFATVKKIEDLNNFAQLKTVADEIQANAKALGVKGAFTSTGMDSSSDWRFKTHLANLPIYYEYKADNITSTDAIKGTYLDNYKNIFDLYITDSTCKATDLANKTGTDAETEFVKGEAVFFQNGTWEYSALTEGGLKDEDLGMLPIYIGVDGEENQGLCTGSENYWCVNANASEDDQKATLDFINWCVTSDKGTAAMADDMGFVIPFKAAKEAKNVLVKADKEYVDAGKTPVTWNFTTMPSEDWKNGVGTALTQYAAGTGKWDDVVKAFKDGWKTEYAKVNA
jgi:raffinose/stachyose/melibiose transport system substrate-binding protein